MKICAFILRSLILVPLMGFAGSLAQPLSEAELRALLKGKICEKEHPDEILHAKPDYCVYVPDQTVYFERMDPKRVGTTYNDHFQVIWDEKRKLFHAFWTQASREGSGDHHICYAKSADGAKTWTEPTILAGSERRACKRFGATWQQPMLTRSGRLYCLWNTPLDSWCGDYGLYGFYSDDGGETWSEPRRVLCAGRMVPGAKKEVKNWPGNWINWQRPTRVGAGGKFCTASSHADVVEFWQYENIDEDPEVQDIDISIFAWGNQALHGQRIAEKDVWKPAKAWRPSLNEGSIVKLPDGRLFMLMRSWTGHPIWSQSRDCGKTWSDPKFLRDADGKPYLHPCSPCPMYDWKGNDAASGVYFAFIHNTFDFNKTDTAYQWRGALYMIAGRFDPTGEQPIRFAKPKLFVDGFKQGWNSFYTSYTVVDGQGVLWIPDGKHFLVGRKIGPEWFDELDFVIADRDKKAACTVVVPKGASESMVQAAKELVENVEKMTGVKLEIVEKLPKEGRSIVLAAVDDAKLGPDGFQLKVEGSRLIVRGSAVRGVLYGVYELLERYGGVSWFSSWCADVPKQTRFAVPKDLDQTEVPTFLLRDAFSWDANKNYEFAAHLRKNGIFTGWSIPAKFGGNAFRGSRGLQDHTFNTLVPLEKYWDTHPEYFSEVNGKRTKSRTQLCLTNPDVLKIATETLLAHARKDPDADWYCVGHNDWNGWCTCPKCRAIDEAEGSPMATELTFANAIAEALEKAMPGKMIGTSAYMYTRPCPKTVVPRKNVFVQMCPFECEYSKPIYESKYAENVKFCKLMDDWSKKLDRMFVFDYVSSFSQYQNPWPNVYSLQPNLKYFRDKGVKYMVEEGAYDTRHADMTELKMYLLSKWMWNPEIDAELLLTKFFNGYYGDAAPFVRRYFDELHAVKWNEAKQPLALWTSYDETPFTDAFFDRSLALWRRAENAVTNDTTRLYNVRMGMLSVVTPILQRRCPGFVVRKTDYPTKEIRELAAWELKRLEEAKPIKFSECGVEYAKFTRRWQKIADPSYVIKPSDRAIVEAEDALDIANGFGVQITDDSKASGGKAIMLPNRSTGDWILHMSMGDFGYDEGAKYRLRIRVRADRRADAPDGELFRASVAGLEKQYKVSGAEGRAYAWYDVGEWTPKLGQVIYIAPGGFDHTQHLANPVGEQIWVDQLEVTRVEGK